MIGCEFHSGQSEGGLVTISSLSTEGEERKKRIKTSTTIPFLDRWNSAPLAVPRISNSLDWKFNRVRVYPRPRYRAVTIERLPVIGRNEVTLAPSTPENDISRGGNLCPYRSTRAAR